MENQQEARRLPSIKRGQPIDITADVVNTGDVAVKDVQVAFYEGSPDANHVLIEEIQVIAGPIPAGGSATAKVTWIVPEVNEPVPIYVVVDPCYVLEDADRTNNTASISPLAPDLKVTSISSERIGPKLRGITIRVANTGVLPVKNVTASLRRNSAKGAELANFVIGRLEPGAYHDLWHIWNIATEDFNNVEIPVHAIVDEFDNIKEGNEENNVFLGMVQVGKLADLTDNGKIDFEDFAKLADYPKVDFAFLAELCESWLWQAAWYSD